MWLVLQLNRVHACWQVNGGSLAERAGLQVGDAVIKVNGQDVFHLSHKGAQDAIVKAGTNFEVVLSRSEKISLIRSSTRVNLIHN